MYKPAPRRARKTNITRSRNGCEACRVRRKKCDEAKPRCGLCLKQDIVCERTSKPLEFRAVSFNPPNPPLTWEDTEQDQPLELESGSANCFSGPLPRSLNESMSHSGAFNGSVPAGLPPAGESLSNFRFFHTSKGEKFPVVYQDGAQNGEDADMDLSQIMPRALQSYDNIFVFPSLQAPRRRGIDWINTNSADKEQLVLYETPAIAWGSEHQISFYINVWDKQCLSALHPAFRHFGILEHNPPIVQEAILSLAACHMSRMLPQRKALTASDIPGLAYRPDLDHQVASQKYYQFATHKLRKWAETRDMSQLNAMLAAMILFCSLESSMGNFEGFNIHFNGVNTLLQMRDNPRHAQDSTQLELQDAWRQTHILNWWRRFHFSTPEFQNIPFPHLVEVNYPEGRDALLWPIYHRVDIMTVMCRALSTLARATILGYKDPSSSWKVMGKGEVEDELAVIRMRSRGWLKEERSSAKVKQAMLPNGDFLAVDSLPPLQFDSHEAAMNYAYQIAAKIFEYSACVKLHQIYGVLGHPLHRTQPQVEYLVWLLQRVAASVKWEDCVRYNTHTIGMSGLLLACAMRSEKLEVGLWIENWLEERRGTAGLEEGSFPVLQILQILRIVNRERRRGFDVSAVFNTTDDGGGAGKFQSYHSQVLDTVVVYATCRDSGERVRKEIAV